MSWSKSPKPALDSNDNPELDALKDKMNNAKEQSVAANIKYHYLLDGGETYSSVPVTKQISKARSQAKIRSYRFGKRHCRIQN